MARRNPADGAALDPAVTQKKRARRRLVGALVLGIAAAIVLPLVLDSEPRQTITDVEIEIPPREAALPSLDSPSHAEVAAPRAAAPSDDAVLPPVPVEPQASAPEPKAEAPTKPDAPAKPDTKSPSRPPDTRAEARPEAAAGAEKRSSAKSEAPKVATAKPHAEATAPRQAESASTKSSAKSAASAAPTGSRFALQLGAFANAGSARAQLDKARRTGLRAYTETVNTAQGERTRVRVGPFATREEAEKARATLKLSGIDSSVVDAR